MANVTAVYLVQDGLTGSLNIEDQSGGRYVRIGQVEFDGTNMDVWAALEAEDPDGNFVPHYGEVHPDDPYSVVVEKTAEPMPDDPRTWKVTVRYAYPRFVFAGGTTGGSPPPPSQGGEPPQALPSRTATWGTYTRQKALRKDRNGVFICNSAGDPFKPPLTIEEQLPELTIVRTQMTFDPTWKYEFEGSINNAAFKIWSNPTWTAEKYSLMVSRINGQSVPATGKTPGYWTVTISIQYDPNTWVAKPLDEGGRHISIAGPRISIIDTGVKTTALLNGSGGILAFGGTPVFLDGVPPATKGPYVTRLTKDFRWLGLDT